MKVLLIGTGQLGGELLHSVPDGIDLVAHDRPGLDITDAAAVTAMVTRLRPAVVINSAAYTAVDRAEDDRDAAFAVNADGAGHVAAATALSGARLVHVSTDFVFDGSRGRPYLPDDLPRPLSVYGASKRVGEERVFEMRPDAVVVRTAWLYAAHGGNFVRTMLGLMGEGRALRVVADQVGAPTWARTLANAIWSLALNPAVTGMQHWTDAGVASWYDFAVAIQEEGLAAGLLQEPATITPVTTADYPTAAARPPYSVLDCTTTRQLAGQEPLHWRRALRAMFGEMAQQK